mgnify:CR=1 FL=1
MRVLSIAATGMSAQQLNVETIANNIANAETVGFKRDLAVFQERRTAAQREGLSRSHTNPTLEPLGGGLFPPQTPPDLTPGDVETTGDKLNVAIPKLKAAADAYPGSDAGIQARYHLAGALATLGKHAEAIAAFDEVIRRAGEDTLYGRTSLLGKEEVGEWPHPSIHRHVQSSIHPLAH